MPLLSKANNWSGSNFPAVLSGSGKSMCAGIGIESGEAKLNSNFPLDDGSCTAGGLPQPQQPRSIVAFWTPLRLVGRVRGCRGGFHLYIVGVFFACPRLQQAVRLYVTLAARAFLTSEQETAGATYTAPVRGVRGAA